MSNEKNKSEVGIGEKGEAPSGAEVTTLTKPEESEVGGRYLRASAVICPYCYSVNNVLEETDYRQWFQCWNCSGAFQY